MNVDQLERIRQRAHAIWEEQGRPEGLADAHWDQASAEVLSETGSTPARKSAPAAKRRKTQAKESVLA